MKQRRTRWFSLLDEPPVNRGWYELQCKTIGSAIVMAHTATLRGPGACEGCRWRGIYKSTETQR